MNHRAASKARRKLIPERVLLWGKEIAVDWAVPEAPVDENVMAKVRVLYVRNLNLSTTEQVHLLIRISVYALERYDHYVRCRFLNVLWGLTIVN